MAERKTIRFQGVDGYSTYSPFDEDVIRRCLTLDDRGGDNTL
jgi:hypothetical protein